MGHSPQKNPNQPKSLINLLKQITQIGETADTSVGLKEIVDLICEELEYYHVGLYLITEQFEGEKYLTLTAASGEVGKLRVNRELSRKIDDEWIQCWVARNHQARIDSYPDKSATYFFPNPLLPDTRSEICLPLLSGEELIGALDIQSVEENAFLDGDIALLQPIANEVVDVVKQHTP